jgi:hypothetical protein
MTVNRNSKTALLDSDCENLPSNVSFLACEKYSQVPVMVLTSSKIFWTVTVRSLTRQDANPSTTSAYADDVVFATPCHHFLVVFVVSHCFLFCAFRTSSSRKPAPHRPQRRDKYEGSVLCKKATTPTVIKYQIIVQLQLTKPDFSCLLLTSCNSSHQAQLSLLIKRTKCRKWICPCRWFAIFPR